MQRLSSRGGTSCALIQAFGSGQLNASDLMIPISGCLPVTEPRARATIEAIQRNRTGSGSMVYRCRGVGGGLPRAEWKFLLCTFWLAGCLAMAGETSRTRAFFETAAEYVSDVGLLAEAIDPGTRELLGNFPQAFSHVGLINLAVMVGSRARPFARAQGWASAELHPHHMAQRCWGATAQLELKRSNRLRRDDDMWPTIWVKGR